MAMLVSTVAALSTIYRMRRTFTTPQPAAADQAPDWQDASIAACPIVTMSGSLHLSDNELSYPENFMNMLWKMVEPKYLANPVIAPLSTSLYPARRPRAELQHQRMRAVGSSQSDPFSPPPPPPLFPALARRANEKSCTC